MNRFCIQKLQNKQSKLRQKDIRIAPPHERIAWYEQSRIYPSRYMDKRIKYAKLSIKWKFSGFFDRSDYHRF